MPRSPNQERRENPAADGPPARGDEAKARPSFDFDLGQGYQLAVECLVQCDSIINSQQERLASKDEPLCSKDEQIAGLEARIVRMSLELADARARENELQHRLRRMATDGGNGLRQ